jgi:hypothetical protein
MPEVGMPLTLAQYAFPLLPFALPMYSGLLLTYSRYRLLGPEAVVDRLIERHQHALALRICDHLQLRYALCTSLALIMNIKQPFAMAI